MILEGRHMPFLELPAVANDFPLCARMMVSVTSHWPVPNSAKYCENIEIPRKRANSAARLNIPHSVGKQWSLQWPLKRCVCGACLRVSVGATNYCSIKSTPCDPELEEAWPTYTWSGEPQYVTTMCLAVILAWCCTIHYLLHRSLCLEENSSTQQFRHDTADRPHINGRRVVTSPHQNLWSSVVLRHYFMCHL